MLSIKFTSKLSCEQQGQLEPSVSVGLRAAESSLRWFSVPFRTFVRKSLFLYCN